MKYFRYLHICLALVLIFSAIYVAFSLKNQEPIVLDDLLLVKNELKKPDINAKLKQNDEDYSKFIKTFANKKIFAQPVTKKKEDLKAKALLKARQEIKTLKLVGVLGQNEKRAIVEDTSSNSTLYAYLGDKLLNKFIVKKIDSSTLVLEFEGNKFTLTL